MGLPGPFLGQALRLESQSQRRTPGSGTVAPRPATVSSRYQVIAFPGGGRLGEAALAPSPSSPSEWGSAPLMNMERSTREFLGQRPLSLIHI